MSRVITQHENPPCPACHARDTIKRGKRRNRLQLLQIFQCIECEHRFTGAPGKHKTYPLRIILEAVSIFNLGFSLSETQRIMRRKAQTDIPERTIRSWVSEFKSITPYARMRNAGKKLFEPQTIVRSITFEHQQVYRFQFHQAKLELLFTSPAHQHLTPLRAYLGHVQSHFPHHLFQSTEHRSSNFPTELQPPITRKENHATQLSRLVLPISPSNKKRHETLQRFMIANDSVTVAVEIPVYLTQGDIAYYRERGFTLNFNSAVITGHIDFLQIRNGFVHLLDYKPEARKEKHAHVQLTIYALALSRRCNLPLKSFKCAWFDEKDYFEFYPLQGVYWPRPKS